ncbi:MAG: hypothetical protein GXP63_04165 [DPANN group archaeon]|nr:hypothetical protein [DPANN group archaeon]
MNPEKEIVNWWLNSKGFFTVNSIKAGSSRDIDIVAIRSEEGRLKTVQHIEIACSISRAEYKESDIIRKFEDHNVVITIKKIIREHLGREVRYEKVLVVGEPLPWQESLKRRGIGILSFADIMAENFLALDKQNYRNPLVRLLQLHKYLVMANPSLLAMLLSSRHKDKLLNLNSRPLFIKELLKDAEMRKVLMKPEHEALILDILRHSPLRNPKRLAMVIDQQILGPRSRNRFIEALLSHKESKKEIAKTLAKEQKQLKSYLS